jgi:hypothetical protein
VLTRTDDAVEAVHTGDGWVLHGTCPLVVNAPIADWLVVSAACEGKKLLCVVRAAADGVAVGPRSALLGLDGLVASPVTLDGARVPADHAIGPLDDLGSLAGLRSLEDQVLAVASVGLMSRHEAPFSVDEVDGVDTVDRKRRGDVHHVHHVHFVHQGSGAPCLVVGADHLGARQPSRARLVPGELGNGSLSVRLVPGELGNGSFFGLPGARRAG